MSYCDHCQNTGWLDCHCGGDLCVCDNNGEYPCPHCYALDDEDWPLPIAENVMRQVLAEALSAQDSDRASRIYQKYVTAYDGEIQGCCPLIADEIQRAIGGEIVAGELTWYSGSCRRTHWWVEKDGKTIDPMGDYILSFEDAPSRVEAHRDRGIFERILPQYEQWRR